MRRPDRQTDRQTYAQIETYNLSVLQGLTTSEVMPLMMHTQLDLNAAATCSKSINQRKTCCGTPYLH